jgi:hypothetical protein
MDIEIRSTSLVQTAIRAARSPGIVGNLAAQIAGPPLDGVDSAERLLTSLVRAGESLSARRPAMTVTDPAAHLAHHVPMPEPGDRAAIDVRVDISVALPSPVLREANRVASTLVAVAPPAPRWAEYHSALIQRWGPWRGRAITRCPERARLPGRTPRFHLARTPCGLCP